MGGQLSWLWKATVGQFWTGTTLFKMRSTIFVRRLLLFLPLGAWLAWEALLKDYSVAAKAPMALLLAPMTALFVIAAWTFAAAMFRFSTIPFLTFGGIFGAPGYVIIKMMDLLWRIEAGPGPAAAQAAETDADIAEQQQAGQQQRLHDAVMYDSPSTVSGAFAGGIRVTAHTPQGPQVVQGPRLSGGQLLGKVDGQEVVVGRVVPSGGGYQVVDSQGGVVVSFDRGGLGPDGAVVVRPTGASDADWQAAMSTERPAGRKLSGGPLAQTLAAFGAVAASWLVWIAAEQVNAWLSEGETTVIAAAEEPLGEPEAEPLPPGERPSTQPQQHDGLISAGGRVGAHEPPAPAASRDITSLVASVSASSQVDPISAGGVRYTFTPANTIDGNLKTCWQEADHSGAGVGQTLDYRFSKPVSIERIEIANGFQWTDNPTFGDLFHKNGRVTAVEVFLDGQSAGRFDVATDEGWQKLSLASARASTVRLKIADAITGSEWSDTSISEVRFVGAEAGG
jgi:hypothetical protein